MRTVESRKPKSKTKNSFKKMVAPLLSLIIIISLIYLLVKHIELLQSGSSDSNLYLWIVLESLGLLFIPLIFKTKRPVSNSEGKHIKNKQDFNLKIKKMITFNSNYSPNIIVKCRKCRFENPSSTKICLNCGNKMDF